MSEKINLPKLQEVDSEDIVNRITESLNFPRTVLASQEDIENVWHSLKRQINKVKIEYRLEKHF